MATACDSSTSVENLGQGLFGVQLEVLDIKIMSIRKQYNKNRNIVPIIIHYDHYLSSHYFARSLQLILEISTTYRLVCYLSTSRFVTNLQVAHAMNNFQEQCQNLFYVMVCLSNCFLQNNV